MVFVNEACSATFHSIQSILLACRDANYTCVFHGTSWHQALNGVHCNVHSPSLNLDLHLCFTITLCYNVSCSVLARASRYNSQTMQCANYFPLSQPSLFLYCEALMHKTCELHCISYYSRLKLDATTSKTVKYTLRYKKRCTRVQANHIESIKFRKLMHAKIFHGKFFLRI